MILKINFHEIHYYRNILGTPESVDQLSRKDILEFKSQHLHGKSYQNCRSWTLWVGKNGVHG